MITVQTDNPTGAIHAVVWIDHHQARIFRFDREVAEATHHVLWNTHYPQHLHHKANSIGSGHVPVNHAFLEAVTRDIRDAKAILIAGPASAKHELYDHIHQLHPALLDWIVGVETLDHPTDGELLTHAAHSFRVAARVGHPYSETG